MSIVTEATLKCNSKLNLKLIGKLKLDQERGVKYLKYQRMQ